MSNDKKQNNNNYSAVGVEFKPLSVANDSNKTSNEVNFGCTGDECFPKVNLYHGISNLNETSLAKSKVNIYLAGPIFTIRDRMFLDLIYDNLMKAVPEALKDKIDVYVPHRNTAINDKTKSANSYQIYEGDMQRLRNTDILAAVISGDIPPAGTTCEIGIFSEMHSGKEDIVALYDDSRDGYFTASAEKYDAMRQDIGESQWPYVNLFVIGCIKSNGVLTATVESFVNAVVDLIKIKLNFNDAAN